MKVDAKFRVGFIDVLDCICIKFAISSLGFGQIYLRKRLKTPQKVIFAFWSNFTPLHALKPPPFDNID